MYDNSALEQTSVAQPPQARRVRRGGFGSVFAWLMVILALVALMGALAALGLLVGERSYAGRIYPNISVRGLNLNAEDEASAREALQDHYEAFMRRPVELNFAGQRWQPSAEELGLQLDIERALREASTAGRQSSRIENARTVQAIWEQGVDVPLHMRVDKRVIQRYLQQVAQSVETAPRDADLHLTRAQVVLTPDQPGLQVLVDDTLADIVAAVQTMETQQVALRTRALKASLGSADLTDVATEARALLQGPVVLVAGEQRWTWEPEQIASWLRLRSILNDSGRRTIALSLEQEPIRRELVPVAEALRQRGRPPRLDWNGGQLKIIQPGSADYGLDAPLTMTLVNQALRGSDRTVELPFTSLPTAIDETNLASLGITVPVGTGVSSFRASQAYRITNIRAGARQMHGLLIPPDGTFSFNDNLGAVDASNGFVEGSAIVDNRTQKEWGGGLCQVSTTMFRAAFWGGLPITERHEHAFRIGWYEELGEPPGLDAAIFTGYTDMRFTNDTGGWLLIQTSVDLKRQRLTITLYGQPTERSVSMNYRVIARTAAPRAPVYINDPTVARGVVKRTDFARPGIKLEVYRTVQQSGSKLYSDTFATEFKPWPNIYVRGTRR